MNDSLPPPHRKKWESPTGRRAASQTTFPSVGAKRGRPFWAGRGWCLTRGEEGAGDGGGDGQGAVALPVCVSPFASPQAAPGRGAPAGPGELPCPPCAARTVPRSGGAVSRPGNPRRSAVCLFPLRGVCVCVRARLLRCGAQVEVLGVLHREREVCAGGCAVASLRSVAAGCLAGITTVTA